MSYSLNWHRLSRLVGYLGSLKSKLWHLFRTSGWTGNQPVFIGPAVTQFHEKAGRQAMPHGEGVQLTFYIRAGQPGAAEALSAKPWGFLTRTFGEQGFQFPRPFGVWTIQNVLFKTMPLQGHAVSAVEAALTQLRRFQEKKMSNPAAQIKSIELRTTAAANLIMNKTGPLRNAADRDHCLQYVVALTILKGAVPNSRGYLDNSPWATSETAVEAKFLQNMAYMFSQAETAHILEELQQDDMLVNDFVNLLARPTANPRL